MRILTRQTVLASLVIASNAIGPSTESAAHDKMHHRASSASARDYSLTFEPARMIELRPGLFISSYSCVTDEGQGRFKPCDSN
jgi:hypothetical protein